MRTLLLSSLCGLALLAPGRARACGGVVRPQGAPPTDLGQTKQRAVLSIHPDRTDVVLQLFVPPTGGFGVLVPAAAEPTLDASPVDAVALQNLDKGTLPQVTIPAAKSSGLPSLGCGSKGSAAPRGGSTGGGVTAGPEVTIGPVVAVKLQADTGAALSQWLNDNGFALPASAQSTVDAYAGPGRWFIAFKASGEAASAPTVGVHFSLPGDHREYALRMTKVGAAGQVAFTVFVAAPTDAAPSGAFTALVLDDLDKKTLRTSYEQAVADAVAKRQGKAWVVEGRYTEAVLPEALKALAEPEVIVTRLSSVVDASTLDADVVFNAPAPERTSNTVEAAQAALGRPGAGGQLWGLLALAAVLGRRRRL